MSITQVIAAKAYCQNITTGREDLQKTYDYALASEPLITREVRGICQSLNGDVEHYTLVNSGEVVKTGKQFVQDYDNPNSKIFNHNADTIKYQMLCGKSEFSDMIEQFVVEQAKHGNPVVSINNKFTAANHGTDLSRGVDCAFMSKTGQLYTVSFTTVDAVFAEKQAKKMLQDNYTLEQCQDFMSQVELPDRIEEFQEFSVSQSLFYDLKERTQIVGIDTQRSKNEFDVETLDAKAFMFDSGLEVMDMTLAVSDDGGILCGCELYDKDGNGYSSTIIGSVNGAFSEEKFEIESHAPHFRDIEAINELDNELDFA